MSHADRLRHLRQRHGLSVPELAALTGYTEGHIYNVEAERVNGSDSMVDYMERKMARMVGIEEGRENILSKTEASWYDPLLDDMKEKTK